MRKKEYWYSIDLMRFICALLVVIIHVNPLNEIGGVSNFIIVQILPRIAVPFFFTISGFFVFEKMIEGHNALGRYIRRLIQTYAIWTIIYWVLKLAKGELDISFKGLIWSFMTGSYYHLWYFPALIFSVIIIAFFFRLHIEKVLFIFSILLYVIRVLGTSYYNLMFTMPLLEKLFDSVYFELFRRFLCMGLVFLSLGVYLAKERKWKKSILPIGVFLFLIEIMLIYKFQTYKTIVITFGLYVLDWGLVSYLLNYPAYRLKNCAHYFQKLSGFVYFAHPLIIVILNDMIRTNSVLQYFIVILVCIGIGSLLINVNNRYTNLLLN